MSKQLRNKIADVNKHKLVEAQLIDIVGGLCAVKVGGTRGNGGVLKGIPFIGPPGEPGQKVYVDYSSGKPLVQIFGQAAEQVTERRTIRSRPSNAEPSSQGGSSSTLPVADHTHDAILLTGTSDAMWYEPSESGLSAALADAQSGDTIYLSDYHFNGPFTIPQGVNLIGATDTQLQYVITFNGDNVVRNINFWQSIAGQQYNIDLSAAGLLTSFYNCTFYSADGTQDIYNVKLGHGGEIRAEFWNCIFEVYASNHDARAFYSTVAHGSPAQPWTKLFYCFFNVRYVTGSHTAELWNSNCKLGTYGCSWLDGLDPGANVFWIDGDRTASSVTDPTAIHTDGTSEISGLTEKASPVDADLLVIEDSAAGYVKKKVQIGNITGETDHGNLDGLSDDDHTQYHTDERANTWLNAKQASYYPTSESITYGTKTAGGYADLAAVGGTDMTIQEANGVNAMLFTLGFTSVTLAPNNILIYGYYAGGANHQIEVAAYNYVSAAYEHMGFITVETGKHWYSFPIFNGTSFIDGSNNASLRFRHIQAGVNSHYLYLDYVALQHTLSVAGSGGVTDHGALQNLDHPDHPASAITVDVTNFDNNLSASDTTVQAALETLDDMIAGSTPDAADVTYTPSTLTDWDGDADPGDVDNALNQLAERVDDLEGASVTGGYYEPVTTGDIYAPELVFIGGDVVMVGPYT